VKILLEAQYQDPKAEKPSTLTFTLEEVGSAAWVRFEIDGRSYDVAMNEFWQAAKALCIDEIRT
jgi:hypothetical protein